MEESKKIETSKTSKIAMKRGVFFLSTQEKSGQSRNTENKIIVINALKKALKSKALLLAVE